MAIPFSYKSENVNLQEPVSPKGVQPPKTRRCYSHKVSALVGIVILEILLIIRQQLRTRAAAVQETLKQAKPKFTPKE